jgi:hypothetical protein
MTDTPFSEAVTLHDESVSPHGIDVVQAESDFHQLERSLAQYQHVSRTSFRKDHQKDLEKAEPPSSEQPFDLREYLSTSNDANQQAGIKHKHVGVTWEDLEVTGVGGIDNKVFPLSTLAIQPLILRFQAYVKTFQGMQYLIDPKFYLTPNLGAIYEAAMFPIFLAWGLMSHYLPGKRGPKTRTIIHM